MVNEKEIVVSITTAAIALANGLSAGEAGFLAAVFTQLGDTLATISIARSTEKSEDAPPSSGGRPI